MSAVQGILQDKSKQSRGRSKGSGKGGDGGRRQITMSTPRSIEKHRRTLLVKLRKAMEENIELKKYNQQLKETNYMHLRDFGGKESDAIKAGMLNVAAHRELNYNALVFETINGNLERLQSRENFQDKNLKGLVKYAKKLTVENEDFKQKVVMSEQILADLKKAGSDNMGSLNEMMKQQKEREQNSIEEIEKLTQLSLIKDDEVANLDIEIKSLHDFLINVTRQQNEKIELYRQNIDDNKKVIRRQDKMIVDLQQKNDLSQNEVAKTQDEISIQMNKKDKLEIKLRELNDQRSLFVDQIGSMEEKIANSRQYIDSRNYNINVIETTEEKRGKRSTAKKDYDNKSVKSAKQSAYSRRSRSSSPDRKR